MFVSFFNQRSDVVLTKRPIGFSVLYLLPSPGDCFRILQSDLESRPDLRNSRVNYDPGDVNSNNV